MKPSPQNDKDRRWHDLVHRAQADTPPPVDLAALLRSLPRVELAAAIRLSLGAEFNLLLGRRVWVTGAIAACGLVGCVWLLNDTMEKELPWLELAASTSQIDWEEGQ